MPPKKKVIKGVPVKKDINNNKKKLIVEEDDK